MRIRRIARLSAGIAMAGALLAGCGGSGTATSDGDDGQADEGAVSVQADEAPEGSASSSDSEPGEGFPTCDEVKAVLGPDVAGLLTLPETENGVSDSDDGPTLGCGWHTPQTAEGSTDVVSYGGVGVGIFRDSEYTEDSMASLGWNLQDPRVESAGAWALKVGGGYDPAAQLDATGVQVVRDGIVVVLTSGGVALQDVPELASLTNDWAVGAGVAVLDLMK